MRRMQQTNEADASDVHPPDPYLLLDGTVMGALEDTIRFNSSTFSSRADPVPVPDPAAEWEAKSFNTLRHMLEIDRSECFVMAWSTVSTSDMSVSVGAEGGTGGDRADGS